MEIMSKLLENKKFLAGHMKVVYALSNMKIYPGYKANYSLTVGNLVCRYEMKYSIYPFSNADYRGKINFKRQKELIEEILKRY